MDVDPAAWSFWVMWLHALSVYCAVAFVHFWFRFRRLEAALDRGERGAEDAYARALQGFPNALYAKMFGRKPLASDAASEKAAEVA